MPWTLLVWISLLPVDMPASPGASSPATDERSPPVTLARTSAEHRGASSPTSGAGAERSRALASPEDPRVAGTLGVVGWHSVHRFFPRSEVAAQECLGGEVDLVAAIVEAVMVLESDVGPGSLREAAAARGLTPRAAVREAGSILGLVARPAAASRERLLPAPDAGPPIEEAWIFYLSVAALGERGFWIAVRRQRPAGSRPSALSWREP